MTRRASARARRPGWGSPAAPSPPGPDLEPDRVFRLSHVGLPPGRREAEGEVAGQVTGEGGRVLHRREAPAQAVVAGAGGQAEPDVRAAGKAPAKGR
ncbi:MAG: hypothetical protein OXF47_10475, partial [Nitrospira sp.]|nr:hypothetical protein [Nitrospira sp.]